MRYLSITLVVIVVWIVGVLLATLVGSSADRLMLFVLLHIFTLCLFLAGFGRNA